MAIHYNHFLCRFEGIEAIYRWNSIEAQRSIVQYKPRGKRIKMADKLRPDELAAFKAAFDMFDKNQDGTISTKVNIRS